MSVGLNLKPGEIWINKQVTLNEEEKSKPLNNQALARAISPPTKPESLSMPDWHYERRLNNQETIWIAGCCCAGCQRYRESA